MPLSTFKTKLTGPPAKGKKYRSAEGFVEYSTLWALSEGFEIKPTTAVTPSSQLIDLVCSTPQCQFRLIADLTAFTSGDVAGMTGFKISRDTFEDRHNHPAPFFPLDLEEESIRRNVPGGTNEPPVMIPRGEMSEFIAQINPALLKHYEVFKTLGFFESNVSDLVGSLSERAIGDLLGSKEAGRLPPFAKAELAEGIKRCRERIAIDPTDVDGSILRGEQREKALRFVEKSILEGAASMGKDGVI